MAATWLMQAVYTSLLSGSHLNSVSGISTVGTGQSSVLAQTAYGTVRGVADFNEQPGVIRYLGIPFAKPPVGSLRFKKPEPPTSWSGVRDASNYGASCVQKQLPGYPVSPNSEDCLFLNVFTPTKDRDNSPLPVMVWIHGGGFSLGSATEYNGSWLAKKGVVVVTIHYRLDIFGFMSTEDDVIPGNYGMLDQIQALKWVQQNIANFGGDPNQVTIFGESAGSASVSLLMLSPLAKGLFHKAIMESGVSLSSFAISHPATRMTPRFLAKLTGASVQCTQQDINLFLACMQGVDAQTLVNISQSIATALGIGSFIFMPRVETISRFLPDLPIRMLTKGQFNYVDSITGYNSFEYPPTKVKTDDRATREEFQTAVSNLLEAFAIPDRGNILNEFQDIYLGNLTNPLGIFQQITAAQSDYAFIGPTIIEMRHLAKMSSQKKHFLYQYDYRKSVSEYPTWITAIHGGELSTLFGLDKFAYWGKNQTSTPDDKSVSEQMLTLWTNFAKTGNPTSTIPQGAVKWEPFVNGREQLLKINAKTQMIEHGKSRAADLYYRILQKIDTVMIRMLLKLTQRVSCCCFTRAMRNWLLALNGPREL